MKAEELEIGCIYRWHYGLDSVYFKLLEIEDTIEGILLHIQPLYKSGGIGTDGEQTHVMFTYVMFETVKKYLDVSNVGEIAIEMLKDVGDNIE